LRTAQPVIAAHFVLEDRFVHRGSIGRSLVIDGSFIIAAS
jgi:hypothetical protein